MLPFRHLPPALAREVFAHLCDCLPPPRDESQAARDARDTIAMAEVVGYDPVDMIEAMLAVRIVASEAHARDALRLAGLSAGDVRLVARCRAQAAMMMRTADKARVELRDCRKERPAIASDRPGMRPIATATIVPVTPPVEEKPAANGAATNGTATGRTAIVLPLSGGPTPPDLDHPRTDAELQAALRRARDRKVNGAHVVG